MILITGVAGFIGFSLAKSLLEDGMEVIGIDNINNYYDTKLKNSRLKILQKFSSFIFYKCDINNKQKLKKIITDYENISYVVHLAAQAGVRYSITNPFCYAKNNLYGQISIQENIQEIKNLKHFIFASSSSVYGLNIPPFSENLHVNSPTSLYAATKIANEVIAHYYSFFKGIPSTGVRFFTVYGPWGRPDMIPFKFADALLQGLPITIYNKGNMLRDFTYINDIVNILKILLYKVPNMNKNNVPFSLYNIGAGQNYTVLEFVKYLEKYLNVKSKIEYHDTFKCDVSSTQACTKSLNKLIGNYKFVNLEEGIKEFAHWYINYK